MARLSTRPAGLRFNIGRCLAGTRPRSHSLSSSTCIDRFSLKRPLLIGAKSAPADSPQDPRAKLGIFRQINLKGTPVVHCIETDPLSKAVADPSELGGPDHIDRTVLHVLESHVLLTTTAPHIVVKRPRPLRLPPPQ